MMLSATSNAKGCRRPDPAPRAGSPPANILHIDCSARPESHSRALSAAIVEELLARSPCARISRRDLGAFPLPHATGDYATTLSSPLALAEPVAGSLDLAGALIHEVEAADAIVIGTPMHNLTVPSVLKAWIDQVLRVGRTMMTTAAGKVGMLKDRPVFVGIASGGVFTGERANQPDFLTPYLSQVLHCIGLRNQQFVSVQATAFLEGQAALEARKKALAGLDLSIVAGSPPAAVDPSFRSGAPRESVHLNHSIRL